MAVAAQDHAVQLAHQAQQLANSHDETIAEVARYKRETDASLRGLRDRISVMDEECAALVAEVAAEKATQLTQRVEMQQEKDAKMREYEEVLTNLRQELQVCLYIEYITDRDSYIKPGRITYSRRACAGARGTSSEVRRSTHIMGATDTRGD